MEKSADMKWFQVVLCISEKIIPRNRTRVPQNHRSRNSRFATMIYAFLFACVILSMYNMCNFKWSVYLYTHHPPKKQKQKTWYKHTYFLLWFHHPDFQAWKSVTSRTSNLQHLQPFQLNAINQAECGVNEAVSWHHFSWGGGSSPNTSETKKHMGGFPKMVGFPNKPMSVSYLKMIMTWGVKWKFSHHFKETPRATQKKDWTSGGSLVGKSLFDP